MIDCICVQKEDVLQVAKDLNKPLTDKQVQDIVNVYPKARKDPRFEYDNWTYIVEMLMDELED